VRRVRKRVVKRRKSLGIQIFSMRTWKVLIATRKGKVHGRNLQVESVGYL
jgi:hypothetical protein